MSIYIWLPIASIIAAYMALVLHLRLAAVRSWQDHETCRLDFETVQTDRTLIAHAAGGSELGSYPNAVECLDQWYAWGIRHFEVDLQPTPDGSWVALHDWGPTLQRWFDLRELPLRERLLRPLRPRAPLPAAVLRSLPMRGGLTVLTPQLLTDWLKRHPDAWLVTDIKAANPAGLNMLAGMLGNHVSQVVAQVFTIDEIRLARTLGFGRVAWANYVPKWPLHTLPDRLSDQPLDLIVLDQRKLKGADDHLHLERLAAQGREIWVFTVNDRARLNALPKLISGVITDRLLPAPEPG